VVAFAEEARGAHLLWGSHRPNEESPPLKAWLITWEWVGDHAAMAEKLAVRLSPRLSITKILAIVDFLGRGASAHVRGHGQLEHDESGPRSPLFPLASPLARKGE
jgi:hypothetical protein